MNVGSLFSGIGGIDLGLERAGMRVLWQVECDPYARAVLRKHWPHAALYDDVRSVGAANLAPVDLICGGFPCQDISNAGKRVGIDGERSGLWTEYARIVRELRPRYVLVENVAALLARGLERVVGDLAACGYDAEWDCFPASAFGAPHRRDRLFVVAYAAGESKPEPGHKTQAKRDQWNARVESGGGGSRQQQPDTGQALADTDSKRLAERRECDGEPQAGQQAPFRRDAGGCGAPALADTASDGWEQGRTASRSGLGLAGDCGDPLPNAHVFSPDRPPESRGQCGRWDVEPDVGRVASRVPARVDRLRCLGNSVVPQVAEWIGRQILAHAEEAMTASSQLPLRGPGKERDGAA